MNIINQIDCKDLSIVSLLTFFTGVWCIHNYLLRPEKSIDALLNSNVVDIPESLQSLFPYIEKGELLNEKHLNMWAVGHSITYFVTGLVVPNRYKIIILISILCEFYEYIVGYQTKLSDLFINTFSYLVGSQITIKCLRDYSKIVCKHPKMFYLSFPICFTFLLLLSTCEKNI